MANEIVLKNDNWELFRLNDNQLYFNQFVETVKSLDNNTSPDLWTKWKSDSNQIVIETPNYYFKIYNDEFTTGEFNSLIREKLAEIYREDFGILWNVKTIYQDNKLYQIEQREKLQVCSQDIISYDDLFLNWSNTLKKLEKKLALDKITKQLQRNIYNLKEIKLVRECVNKFADYAITKNGDIVLLDDADWFFELVDNDNKWLSNKFTSYHILTSIGDRVFVPENFYEVVANKDINYINILSNKWIITRQNDELLNTEQNLRDLREQMLFDNIQVLSSGKKLENKCLYVNDPNETLLLSN